MKKILKVLKVVQLIIKFPFDIENGAKKSASVRLKKALISANLL